MLHWLQGAVGRTWTLLPPVQMPLFPTSPDKDAPAKQQKQTAEQTDYKFFLKVFFKTVFSWSAMFSHTPVQQSRRGRVFLKLEWVGHHFVKFFSAG